MTVKEVFELRKQGKIEEAYAAIKPMYAFHKGKYTTLCMFWTASDVFKLRLEQGRIEEAEKIFEALKRLLPDIEDKDDAAKKAKGFIGYAEGRLIKESPKFRKRYFAIKDWKKKRDKSQATATTSPDKGAGPNDPLGARTQDPNEGINFDVISCSNPSNEASEEGEGISKCLSELGEGQHKVLECLKANPGYSVPKIVTETGIPAKSVERQISALMAKMLIEHRGSKKTGGYFVVYYVPISLGAIKKGYEPN